MMQRTIFGELVPIGPHRDDIVLCSDGAELRHEEVLYDVNGGAHSNEEDRFYSESEAVKDYLDALCKWSADYTQHDDYASMFDCCVWENWGQNSRRIAEWIRENYPNLPRCIVEDVLERIRHCNLLGEKYCSNEYASFSGDGVCIDSFDIGEYEDQIEIANHALLKALNDCGRLADCLEVYNGDGCIGNLRRYDSLNRGYFYLYSCPGGQWQFYVSRESIESAVTECIVEFCRKG